MPQKRTPDLPTLIHAVEESAEEDPVARLRAAEELSEDLAGLADELVDHYISEARRDGRSWSEIGQVLGVSKQAAQQRFVLPDLASFDCAEIERPMTPRVRRAIKNAHKEARRLGVDYVDTEHILLGLLREKRGLAVVALAEAGISGDELRASLDRRFVPNAGRRTNGTLTRGAARALQLSLQESRRLGHNYLGTEHVLLGLLKLREGLAHDVLVDAGAIYDVVKAKLLEMLHEPVLSISGRGKRMKVVP